jgi:hypothetical protein
MAAMYYLLPITNLEMITTQFEVLTCKPWEFLIWEFLAQM